MGRNAQEGMHRAQGKKAWPSGPISRAACLVGEGERGVGVART